MYIEFNHFKYNFELFPLFVCSYAHKSQPHEVMWEIDLKLEHTSQSQLLPCLVDCFLLILLFWHIEQSQAVSDWSVPDECIWFNFTNFLLITEPLPLTENKNDLAGMLNASNTIINKYNSIFRFSSRSSDLF